MKIITILIVFTYFSLFEVFLHANKVDSLSTTTDKPIIANTTLSSSTTTVEKNFNDDLEDLDDSDDNKIVDRTKMIENEDDDDDEDDEDFECDNRLSTFVRSFNTSQLLPDDYEELSDFMHQHGVYGHIHHINGTLEVLDRMLRFLEKIKDNKDLTDTLMYISSVTMDKMYEAKMSTQCMADLAAIGNAFRDGNRWAFDFPDSFGLIFGNIFHGQASSFGQYDKCVSIKSPLLSSGRHVYGKYCTLHLSAITPPIESYDPSYETIFRSHRIFNSVIMRAVRVYGFDNYVHGDFARFITEATDRVDDNIYHNGICLPNSCSTEEIANFINEFLYPFLKMSVRIPEKMCSTHSDLSLVKVDNYQLISISIIGSILLLTIICTIVHLFINRRTATDDDDDLIKPNDSLLIKMIGSFSIVENTKNLFKKEDGVKRYVQLDTIRVLLTLAVFPINSYGLTLFYYPQIYRDIDGMTRMEMLNSNGHWLARIPSLWFEGFVFLGGVFTIFKQFDHLKRLVGEFNYINYIWKRWFRMSFAIGGTILLIYLFPLVGDGPMWFYQDQYYVEPCRQSSGLLSSFLYYSNWNEALDQYTIRSTLPICNPPTWFTSSLFQLYMIAPLLFLPLFYWPVFGMVILTILIIIGPIISILPRILLEYPSYIEVTKFSDYRSNQQAIIHSHMSPFLYLTSLSIGMLTGYLIKFKPDLQFGGRIMATLMWLVSLISVVIVFIWHNTFLTPNIIQSTNHIVLWFMYQKLVWPIFLGLTAYLSCTGRCPILQRLLNIPSLLPIARLSLSIYLIRSLTIFYRKTTIRNTYQMYYYQSIQNIVFDFMITAILAYVMNLLFQEPANRLWNVLTKSVCKDNVEKKHLSLENEEQKIAIENLENFTEILKE